MKASSKTTAVAKKPEANADADAHKKGQARAALRPYPDELMLAWRVSRRANNPRLPNDASLIEPS